MEVDFVATKGSEKYYIQSAFDMNNEEKIAQEQRSLVNISDSFKKSLSWQITSKSEGMKKVLLPLAFAIFCLTKTV